MTFTDDDKRFVTQRVAALVGIAVLVLGGLAIAGLNKLSEIKAFVARTRAAATPGDTPVVLIGGTVTFKAGAKGSPQPWTPVTTSGSPPTEFYVSPNYSISAIALKDYSDADLSDNPNPNDAIPAKDKIHVNISNAGTWEIDAYATHLVSGQPVEAEVASLTPVQNGSNTEIHLKLFGAGFLCPNGSSKRITYGQAATCTDAANFTFSRVTLLIDNGSGVTTTSGTLTCVDDSANPVVGHCRIVFRGPSS